MSDPEHVWSRMDLAEFQQSGLLWRVNEAVLWPLGLALTYDTGDETAPPHLFVQRVDPFDTIRSGATVEEYEDYLTRFTTWLRKRLGAADG